jgi:hypothetical protein
MFILSIGGTPIQPLPIVDDRLMQLLKAKVMNTHQFVLLTTTITIPNVFVLGIQAVTTLALGSRPR